MSKKLINDPADVVDEALAGLASASPGIKLLKGHRVAVRADIAGVVGEGKVSSTVLATPYHKQSKVDFTYKEL